MSNDASSEWDVVEGFAERPAPAWPYPDRPADWPAVISRPRIAETAWVAPGAVVQGRVRLAERSSVWYGCVLRGDDEFIEVGAESNVQDGSILHVDPDLPCQLGDRVTLGHRAIVHASVVEDDALIGIGATVLSGCVVGAGAVVAAGAVVREGTRIPAGTLWAGVPAKELRPVSPELAKRVRETSHVYVNKAAAFLARFGDEHVEALRRGDGIAPAP